MSVGDRGDRQRLGRRHRVDGDGLAGGGADIAGGVDDPRLVGEARAVRWPGRRSSSVVASTRVTSTQVVPPSLLTCTFSPAASAPLVPETVSEVSLVMKSLDDVPVSVAIAVIASASAGAVVSMVTAWLAVVPTLAAASMIRAW